MSIFNALHNKIKVLLKKEMYVILINGVYTLHYHTRLRICMWVPSTRYWSYAKKT